MIIAPSKMHCTIHHVSSSISNLLPFGPLTAYSSIFQHQQQYVGLRPIPLHADPLTMPASITLPCPCHRPTLACACGCFAESLGFVGRILLHYNPVSQPGFIMNRRAIGPSPLMMEEGLFVALDKAMVLLAMIALTVFHPGWSFPQMARPVTLGNKATLEEGKASQYPRQNPLAQAVNHAPSPTEAKEAGYFGGAGS